MPKAKISVVSVSALDSNQAVCIAVYVPGELTSRLAFGANERTRVLAAVRSLRAKGIDAYAEWCNVGPWCAELWTKDLSRPFGISPARFYGDLYDAACEERTGIYVNTVA